MQRKDDLRDDLIDLGSVTAETKGGESSVNDQQNGLKPIMSGLSDD